VSASAAASFAGGELERTSGPLEVSVGGVRDAGGVGEFFGDERGSGELARVVVGVAAWINKPDTNEGRCSINSTTKRLTELDRLRPP
jgi:hypothetical protein